MRLSASATVSTLVLALVLRCTGALGDNGRTILGNSGNMDDNFKEMLLERDLLRAIPTLEDEEITSFQIFESLDENDLWEMPLKRGHRKIMLKWLKLVTTSDPQNGIRRMQVKTKKEENPSQNEAKMRSEKDYPSPNATHADWGSAEYAHCEQPYSWPQLNEMYKRINRQNGSSTFFKMGGLGKLLEEDGYETWQCLRDHYCAVNPDDPWFCFVYHETNKTFSPWGENSRLKLVRGKSELEGIHRPVIIVPAGVTNAVPVIRVIDDEYIYMLFLHTGTGNSTTFTIDVMKDIPSAEVLMSGGGGGGGGGHCGNRGSGGGGAGGLIWIPSVNIPNGSYEIIVGDGGSAGPGFCVSVDQGKNGHASSFLGYTAMGGGGGGGASGAFSELRRNGLVGGSGGGGADYHGDGASGLQTNISSTYGYGNAGGGSTSTDLWMGGAGGGGGGAGGPGEPASSKGWHWGNGGVGKVFNITGIFSEYARGGHGSGYDDVHGSSDSVPNTGNGGNAGGKERKGQNGAAGIVIIRHKILQECSSDICSFRSSRCDFEFRCN
jgi:hypothetical protein